jgi:hypothetical protein
MAVWFAAVNYFGNHDHGIIAHRHHYAALTLKGTTAQSTGTDGGRRYHNVGAKFGDELRYSYEHVVSKGGRLVRGRALI